MTTKRKYTAEFNREAVLQTQHPEVSCAQVARELGINSNVIGRWKRELARVKKEHDFLLEAVTFFARESS
jgi:transposase